MKPLELSPRPNFFSGMSLLQMAGNDHARGGSPYGAGTLAGADGSRQPSETELKIAMTQGKTFAKFVNRLQ